VQVVGRGGSELGALGAAFLRAFAHAGPASRVTTSPLRGPSSRTAQIVESLIATGFPPQRRTIPRPAGRHLGVGTQHRSRGSHLRVFVAVRQAIALVGVLAGVLAHAPDPRSAASGRCSGVSPAAPACRTRSASPRVSPTAGTPARSVGRTLSPRLPRGEPMITNLCVAAETQTTGAGAGGSRIGACWRPALGCGAIDVAVASPVAASASVGDHLGKAGQRTLARFGWFASV
jgi:hypothetical protein